MINGSSVMSHHHEQNVPYDILKLLGPEKASELFMGEPVKNMDAWVLLDHIRKQYRYETIYEDEGGENTECYIVMVFFENKYVYVLLKSGEVTKGYLLEILSFGDLSTTKKLALEEYKKCLLRYGEGNSS